MTDDTQNEQKSQKKSIKKKTAQGPIRLEAVVPFLVFCTIVWVYFFFFFDNHLRRAMEFIGTHANGAEVNIADVRTSFWNASLQIETIQITDLDDPAKNKIQLGTIRWKMLWDALLRGKIAIEDASILNVAIGVTRTRPGRVLPPDPPDSKSLTQQVREQAMDKIQQEFSKNILGDVASLLSGVNPADQLKNIEGQLKSSMRIKELETELKQKEVEWKQRIDDLPKTKDIESLQTRIKSVKLDKFNNPTEIQSSLTEIDSIFREVDTKYREVQGTQQTLNSDVGNYQNSIKELDAMIRQDIKDLEDRIRLPKVDAKSISQSIFGPMILNRTKQIEYYISKARKYMPPKKSVEEKAKYGAPTPHERQAGRNYKFGRPRSYPLFWLKNSEISSTPTKGAEWSGDIKGSLQNLTDDPPVLGIPTTLNFEGDFPQQQLLGVLGKLTIDHTTENPVEKLDLKVGSFPVSGQKLVTSDEVNLSFQSAFVSSLLNAELRGEEIKLQTQSGFQRSNDQSAKKDQSKSSTSLSVTKGTQAGEEADKKAHSNALLVADAKNPILANILQSALSEIPKVTLDAGLSGPWTALRLNIDSNLGRELAGAFEKQLQLKINEAKAKLNTLVDEQIGTEKQKLLGEYTKLKSQIEREIQAKQVELDKAKNSTELAKNEVLQNQNKRIEGEGKKALEDLKKQIKF